MDPSCKAKSSQIIYNHSIIIRSVPNLLPSISSGYARLRSDAPVRDELIAAAAFADGRLDRLGDDGLAMQTEIMAADV